MMKLTLNTLKLLIREIVEEQEQETSRPQLTNVQKSAANLGKSEIGSNIKSNKLKQILPNLMLNDKELNAIKSLNPQNPKKAAFINHALSLLSQYLGK